MNLIMITKIYLNSQLVKNIFQNNEWLTHKPSNITVYSNNTERHGDKSLTTLGPRIWKSLPEEVKTETEFSNFKKYIKQLLKPPCKCIICSLNK